MPMRSMPLALVALAAVGCSGEQSALAPASRQAVASDALWWWMAWGSLVTWLATLAVAAWCVRGSSGAPNVRRDRVLIIGGGVVIPVAVLTALLIWGLMMIPPLVARAPDGSLLVTVVGEQWWWRIRYQMPDGTSVEVANELQLPVGEPVQFRLESDNVIHSFWIPALGGKMDMIPGRVTWLAIEPTVTGSFRGACAEYCGGSHALMGFAVTVTERDEFDAWLARQAAPSSFPADPQARAGQDVFLAAGCGACHTVRGTAADGVIGPDLTHVGSRRGLAGLALSNDPAAFRRWLVDPEAVKPDAHMPPFGMLQSADLDALAQFLEGLQ